MISSAIFWSRGKQLLYNYNYGPDAMYYDVRPRWINLSWWYDTGMNPASAKFFFVYPQPETASMLYM